MEVLLQLLQIELNCFRVNQNIDIDIMIVVLSFLIKKEFKEKKWMNNLNQEFNQLSNKY